MKKLTYLVISVVVSFPAFGSSWTEESKSIMTNECAESSAIKNMPANVDYFEKQNNVVIENGSEEYNAIKLSLINHFLIPCECITNFVVSRYHPKEIEKQTIQSRKQLAAEGWSQCYK